MDRLLLEKELKYLLTEPNFHFSIVELEKVFEKYGYLIAKASNTREKFEEYFDDANFSLLKRGDILRRTKHRWYDRTDISQPLFTYKEKVGNEDEPYTTRLEHKKDNITNLYEFVRAVNVGIIPDEKPKLTLSMVRKGAYLDLGQDKFYLAHDRTTYTNPSDGITYTEDMLEVEDRGNINNLNPVYDYHLRRFNREMLGIGLPIRLTKDNKYERGSMALLGFEK